MATFDNRSEAYANDAFEAAAIERARWSAVLAAPAPRKPRASAKPVRRGGVLAPFVSLGVVLASMAGAGADIARAFFG